MKNDSLPRKYAGDEKVNSPWLSVSVVSNSMTMPGSVLPPRDSELVQIVDAAFAEAARKSGDWLKCKPGCTQCCIGVFAINQLDAARLRQGMRELETRSRETAAAVRERAQAFIERFGDQFPGDPRTSILYKDRESKRRFEDFANDEPCPALNPQTGLCELYEARPTTCRVFGPPIRSEEGLGVCELCFQGATVEEIAACEIQPDPNDLESELIREAEKNSGRSGETIVAYCLGR
jgi:Fe-S-cluster containining protein